MSSAEPPAGRRPEGERAPGGAPSDRPMSRDDLFGPDGPFGVSGTPATPRGAGSSGFEPPDPDDEPTRAMPPADEAATRAFRPVDDEPTRAYRPAPPGAADRTQVRPPGDEYTPGQYQPRSMGAGYPARAEYEGPYTPGQYQPGQYQAGYSSRETMGYPGDAGPGSGQYWNDGSGGGRGRRSWVVAAVVALAVVAAGAGAAYALLNGGKDTPAATGATSAPQATSTGDEQPTEEPSATESATESPSASPSATGDAQGEAIPADPWTDPDLDFGYLTKVSRSGDQVKLTFNRATFYYGDEATKHNGGTPPDNDYLIEDTNKKLRTFALKDGAALRGSTLLGGDGAGPDGIAITPDDLVANAEASLAGNSQGVPVWLRHEKGKESAVTALAEQYTP